MSRPRKSRSSSAMETDGVGTRLMAYFDGVNRFLQEFLFRAGRPVDTMWQVAQERYQAGDYMDAASRLRLVVKLQPENADAWYLLGFCELEIENESLARVALRKALQLNPQYEEARFLLAVLTPDMPVAEQPKIAPLSLVVQHFDAQAGYYDQYYVFESGYTGHDQVYYALRHYLNPLFRDFTVADIGCGTGLAGMSLRHVARHVEGVDVSRNMLAQADAREDEYRRQVFDTLHHMDLRHYLLHMPEGHRDIVVAANVFSYIGGLTPVFDGLARILTPGGWATFSIEPLEVEEFALIPAAGRYGHSPDYIVSQAKRVGLEVAEMASFEMFPGEQAIQFVLRKPGKHPGQNMSVGQNHGAGGAAPVQGGESPPAQAAPHTMAQAASIAPATATQAQHPPAQSPAPTQGVMQTPPQPTASAPSQVSPPGQAFSPGVQPPAAVSPQMPAANPAPRWPEDGDA